MYQEIKKYLENPDFKIVFTPKYMNVINYSKIIILEDEKIEILIKNKILKIRGTNLKLKRILNSELLIEGVILELKMIDA